MRLFLFHRGGSTTNRDADSWAGARVGIRAVNEVGVMKRHLTRTQNDIDCLVHVDSVANCVTTREDVHLPRFFEMLERARVSSGQHTEAAIVYCAVCERDPCGNQTWL